MNHQVLVSAEDARLLDEEAQGDWALHPFALVETAGRACADVFCAAFPRLFPGRSSKTAEASFPRIIVLAGGGNNGADALVMLRALILRGFASPDFSGIVVSHLSGNNNQGPRTANFRSLKKMGVPVIAWDEDAGEWAGRASEDALALADIIIDGLAGTGLREPLKGPLAEMVLVVNKLKARNKNRPLVVSIDMPSGNFDGWMPGMSILNADAVLAIEPRKLCLYKPAARPFEGTILSVGGIFPPALIEKYGSVRLIDWESASAGVGRVKPDAYKYDRGLVEIRAGSPGATGAAKLAARGAQAAGAGLVRLIADPSIYSILAAGAWGVMVVPDEVLKNPGTEYPAGRFCPDAALLGPGWGSGPDRARILPHYLSLEAQGMPLVLDADAITLAAGMVFHGNVILTPHPGEFAAYTGTGKEEILADPGPLLLKYARERKAVILFKSHVLYLAAPDGRLGIIDGMVPCLAAGGSGDILAGFCVAIAARMRRQGSGFDAYVCAAAAASLLIRAGRSPELAGRFSDPSEIANMAASLAGSVWLPPETDRRG
ncbi:MAG: bifunctional ADP-dependent NAD(P)H-hydrate dehydratase/NAD(P)H-hydrate epimerase [Treponema sp.]|jgi:NAD(P)H-hydrate epimerase|nr:bifunctional ADP-dependent NAD(P)H-hydrate dehydratase/NAD(P)H-hydrate epimerase [Treponema sp.]